MATISEQLTQLSNIKADIKSALIEKGQNATNAFNTYANLIRNIRSDQAVYYTGSTEPDASIGNDGDLYLQIEE